MPCEVAVQGQPERASQAGVAQLVEYKLPKLGVAGSNPVARSIICARSFSAGAVFWPHVHRLRDSVVPTPRWRRWPLGRSGALAGLGRLCGSVGRICCRIRSLIRPSASSRAGGFDLVLGRAEVRPLRGEVRLEGVALTHFVPGDPTLHGAPVLSVGAVEAQVGWQETRPGLGRLEIWRPSVHLRVGPDGIRELEGIEMNSSAERFPWNDLFIHDGRLVVQGPEWVVQATVDVQPARGTGTTCHRTPDFRMREFRQVVEDIRVPDVACTGRVAVPDPNPGRCRDLAAGISVDRGDLDGHFDVRVRLAEPIRDPSSATGWNRAVGG